MAYQGGRKPSLKVGHAEVSYSTGEKKSHLWKFEAGGHRE